MSSLVLKMPDVEAGSAFVPTLNKQGYMTNTRDAYMQAFVDYAAGCARPVADIGAAYGVAAIPALATGAAVVAVDPDERHLAILRQQTPEADRPRLTTITAEFPEGLSFASNSMDAFLVARVVHFFTPERLEMAVAQLFDWLAPGGKLFLTADTPYLASLKRFAPVYEQRRREGNLWPGHVENTADYVPNRSDTVPASMFYLDPDILRRVLTAAGFIEEKIDFLPRPEYPADLRNDGRESVGAIVCKPQ